MSEFFFLWGLFAVKLVTVVVLLLVGVMAVAGVVMGLKQEKRKDGKLVVRDYNSRYQHFFDTVHASGESEKAFKARIKKRNQQEKREAKKGDARSRLYVIDFDGDIKASATASLAHCVSAVVHTAEENDAVLLRLESGGGLVHAYGLAAAQLERLREAGVHLTVSVDKVAASGGYMMATMADRIIAAPFAVIGSVGVVAQLPNVHKLLKKNDIDIEYHTAGKYKRTLTVIGENTKEGRQKFVEDLDHVHQLFKAHIARFRSAVDVDSIATGEVWYGSDALEKGLVDALTTSDAFLLDQLEGKRVLHLSYETRPSLGERLGVNAVGSFLAAQLGSWTSPLLNRRF